MNEYSQDISNHTAKPISLYELHNADLLVAMTENHATLLKSFGADNQKLIVLNVPDPFGKPLEAYRECASVINAEVNDIYERFKKELNDYNTLSSYAVESNFLNNDNDNDLINIADYYFDFDNTSHKIYNVLDSLDNKFAYFNENVEYISLYPYYIVDDDYTQFRVNVSFDLKTYTDNKLPILVFSVGDFYQSVPLISMYDESLNTGNLEHFNKKINIVNKGKSYKGEKLKIYFWNTSKDRMMFDNVKVLIKASK